ncbi:hypothetical protein EYF80_005859 [Liparis tanakae]|uniref:Uncharacterized protein n=1 Tax=Liparis tanakae TaxID=230148 RepID=A0A4Z2J2Q1_9TELE|nr:hypothetical protein EYF80_005859 [Liparis tanakae]
MALATLKQGKLARIVDHSKLFQQNLDDLSSRTLTLSFRVWGKKDVRAVKYCSNSGSDSSSLQ